MSFIRNYTELENFVKNTLTPFAKTQLKTAALQYLNSGPVLKNIHTDLLIRGTTSIELTLKTDESRLGFDDQYENMVWICPVSSSEFMNQVHHEMLARQIFWDISSRRKILDELMENHFHGLNVTDILHLKNTSRYTIRK